MKFTSFILSLFLSLSTLIILGQGLSAWERVTPHPQEHTINDICRIPNTNKIIAVGEGSFVMITDNGGESWNIYNNPAGLNNRYFGKAIYFTNENIGFIAGSGKSILKTANGGLDWEKVYQNGPQNRHSYSNICFANDNNGFAVGSYSKILRTIDGGETWYEIETNCGFNLKSVAFYDQYHGYIVGSSGEDMLSTSNGGNTWELKYFNAGYHPDSLSGICFVNETTGYIIGEERMILCWDGTIYKTTDAGETWIDIYTRPGGLPQDIDFIDENTGIVGFYDSYDGGALAVTDNSGAIWFESNLSSLNFNKTRTICCITEDAFISAGDMGMMYKSENDPTTWIPLHQRDFNGNIVEVEVVDEDLIFAIYYHGYDLSPGYGLRRSINGGETWSYIASSEGKNSICMLNDQTGFHIDRDNIFTPYILYRTDDAGNGWAYVATIEYDFEVLDCEFIDEQNGILAGYSHALLTSDGGISWQDVSGSYFWTAYNDVHYKNENEVFICGSDSIGGMILKSTDGGLSWNYIYSNENLYPNKITFISEYIGFVASSHIILKTIDGGNTWYETTINSPNYQNFRSISFPDENTGYAVGYSRYETIFKTTDGGETWNPINSISTSTLNAVHFFNDSTGLVFGDNGVVIKTTNGGVTGFEETTRMPSISVFNALPNPFNNEITIDPSIPNQWSSRWITIYDQTGKQIQFHKINSLNGNLKIKTDKLSPGIYFIQLKTDKGLSETKKMIKL